MIKKFNGKLCYNFHMQEIRLSIFFCNNEQLLQFYVKIYSHVDSNIQNKTRTFQGSYAWIDLSSVKD